ncbi:MAG: LytTR family transcriptional regulator DNA-binding domain-containing protein, partial [Clostridiales bacterium]|nr:LytTR family transcriptional regulator DNA-binding domain-containing protein [Clostridiales bacterium]
AGRIILIGSAQSSIPHETWFDYEVFNFVREGNETEVLNRFAEVFRKAVDAAAKARQEKLVLSYAGDIRQIDIADILYLERQDRGLTVYYGESESFYFISTLAKMENQLQGRNFHRASKAFLICVDAVQQITGTEALLRNGVKIPVGRQYYPALKEAAMQGAASV